MWWTQNIPFKCPKNLKQYCILRELSQEKICFSLLTVPRATAFWTCLGSNQTFHHCLVVLSSSISWWFELQQSLLKVVCEWFTDSWKSVQSVHFTASSSPHLLSKACSFSHHTFFKPLSGFALNATLFLHTQWWSSRKWWGWREWMKDSLCNLCLSVSVCTGVFTMTSPLHNSLSVNIQCQ